SIRAVAVVGALRAAGFEVGVQDVFKNRTVAELAELLAGRRTSVETKFVQPFELISTADRARLPEALADAYPLSQVQLGMLIEMLGDASANKYHNCTSFRIHDTQPFS